MAGEDSRYTNVKCTTSEKIEQNGQMLFKHVVSNVATQNILNQQYPVVSILIPAYNVAAYLPHCLDSIVNQTYLHLQVVVVDDGSKDNTLEIARQYAEIFPFIEVHHQENAGVATARSTLISLAKGDYVLFIDSDDWIECDMVEYMLKTLERSKCDMVVCGCVKELNGTSIVCPVVNNECYLIEGTENVIKALLVHKELNGSLCNKIVPRKFYDGLTFRKDIWYGEDCLFFWQALNRGVQKICFMPDCFYHYRMNDQSISHEKFNYKKMTGHEVWKQISEDVQTKWPALSDLGKATYAISDMWLLFFASRANYPFDENLRLYQNNVRLNLKLIYKSGVITKKKFLFAAIVAYSYKIGGVLIRYFKY